jgi:ribose-phosphate pyrophosphokinase
MFKSTCVFSGNSNPALAEKIANYLELPIGRARVSRFSDGEVFAEIKENVRGVDVYVIQSTCAPVNDNLMELLVMVDALKRASAGSITAVVPYYGYARQDRKAAPRTPITAKLVADLLSSSGVDRVVSMDLHAGQIQGFFNKPFDHLYAMPVFLQHLRPRFSTPPVFVSPDAGGVERTRAYAKRLDADLAIIDKRREEKNVSEVMHIIGDVDGRECHRRHDDQCGSGPARPRGQASYGGRYAPGFVGPGARAYRGFPAGGGHRDRHHPASGGSPGDRPLPRAFGGKFARRGHQTDSPQRLGELAVRMIGAFENGNDDVAG